jgi:hypothetical protein
LRFTVRRPPCGEVSLCCHRPSGGDIAGSVNVGVARPDVAGDAHEDRLTLAVFACDVPAVGASLRRIRGWDPFDSSRGFVLESGDQPTPCLNANRTVETALLGNPKAGLINRASSGARHCAHIEVLHPDRFKSLRKVGGGLFDPVASPVRLARFDFRDRAFSALSAVGTALGARYALLQSVKPSPLAATEAGGVQQVSGGQRGRYNHPSVDSDHAAIGWPYGRIRNVRKSYMPAAGAISRYAVGLHTRGHSSRPVETDPSDFGDPHLSVTPVELFDVAQLEADLSEALMNTGLAPRGTPVGAGEEIPHSLSKVAQRLLLYGLRPGRQPPVFKANLGQLRRLLVIPRRVPPRLPELLLLNSQIPHETGLAAVLQQEHLLGRGWRQPEPRHSRRLVTTTDNNGRRMLAHVRVRGPGSHECRGLPPLGYA